MSLELMGAVAAKMIKCPKCSQAITQTRDYRARFLEIPQVGGRPLRRMVGDDVTLVCSRCGWQERTDNWREFIAADPG